MKLTKNQSLVLLAGVIVWFFVMIICYGTGYLTHQFGHF